MNLRTLVPLVALAVFCGCATRRVESLAVGGEAERSLETRCVRQTVEKMIVAMLADEAVVKEIGVDSPVLDIRGVANRTVLAIDTAVVESAIRNQLIPTLRLRFVDSSSPELVARLSLYGEVTERASDGGDLGMLADASVAPGERVVKVDLSLKDLGSGEIVWADEREIPLAAGR